MHVTQTALTELTFIPYTLPEPPPGSSRWKSTDHASLIQSPVAMKHVEVFVTSRNSAEQSNQITDQRQANDNNTCEQNNHHDHTF
jgi:hypothetical protein